MRMPRLVRGLAKGAAGFLLLASPAVGQQTTRVSLRSTGKQPWGPSDGAAISADGMVVAFFSDAEDLVPGDTNHRRDVFVHDRTTGVTERVSVDSAGLEANDWSEAARVSADGQVVVFCSGASNLVANDTNGRTDVFVHDRSTGLTERISVDSRGNESNGWSDLSALSGDGRIVAFASSASNLVSGDTNGSFDVFVHDRSTGITERVSVDSSGAEGDGDSEFASISTDGQTVAFFSHSTNLVVGDTNSCADVFVHDRASGLTECVSVDSSGGLADGESSMPSLSADGRFVVFSSRATTLVGNDRNGAWDVFLRDRSTGRTDRVSVDSSGAEGDGCSDLPSITSDGQAVAFSSGATNLVAGDTNNCPDVFVHDGATGRTERVSLDSNGVEGDRTSGASGQAISGDGAVVTFASVARNLVADDTNRYSDVFVKEFCSTAATWSNYGDGFPGTHGVPTLTAGSNPVLGTTVTVYLMNSYGNPTVGVLFVGFQRTSLHSNWGGDLLVVPAVTMPITFSFGFDWFTGDIPNDRALCGVTLDLQAIEFDPGAAKGVSFTPGLELILGR